MKRPFRWDRIAFAAVLLFLLAAGGIELLRHPKINIPKIAIGAKDQVYYSREATPRDAIALGQALQATGFLNDRGTAVLLSKHGDIREVSFVVDSGAWNHPITVTAFEEIGRRIATSVGGFPIEVHLTDAAWKIHKSLKVGKLTVGAKDAVYYFGSATTDQAKTLAQALRILGYLQDQGATVAIWIDDARALGFVVSTGVWDRPDAVAGFEQLARRIAPPIGGLPLTLRLLDGGMSIRKEIDVK